MQKSAILDCRYFAEPLTFTRKFAEAVEDSKGLQHLIFVPNFAADFTTQTAKKDEKNCFHPCDDDFRSEPHFYKWRAVKSE